MPRGFDHVETWVFDLDNTLYPPSSRLFDLVDTRITAFVAEFYGLDGLSAKQLQKYFYRQYGTTLKGLMAEDGLDPVEFLEFVHDIDRTSLLANLPLATAIEKLEGKRYILTNGSKGHAEKTAAALGIGHLFDGVFDIAAADYAPKPLPETYERFLDRFGVEPTRAAMFEDLARNLEVPHALGMTTVLVLPDGEDLPERLCHADDGVAGPHVDHVTNNLSGFLETVKIVADAPALTSDH